MSAASLDAFGTDRDPGSEAYRDEDFPGCESFHLPASEVDGYEGRLEFWDGHTETAWKVCDPTSIYHEQPSRRLGRMAERVASLRGSAIECFGSADLVRLDAAALACTGETDFRRRIREQRGPHAELPPYTQGRWSGAARPPASTWATKSR